MHPTAFVFLNRTGTPCRPDDLRIRRLYPLLERAGVERGRRSFHAFRHSHLSHTQEAGVSLAAVAKRARHANPGVTSAIYSHSSEEADRAAADAWRQHLDADEITHG